MAKKITSKRKYIIGVILGQLYKIKRHVSKNDRLKRLVLPSCMLDYQDAERRSSEN